MSDPQMVVRAAAPLVEIIRHVKPDQLDSPTPCAEYDVRKLVNHLLFWGPSLAGAGRKKTVPPPARSETELDLTGPDWAAALTAQVEGIVAAWAEPAAWTGTTHMGGPTELPAALVGGMVVSELVVHAWDLARATEQQPDWDGELLGYVHDEVGRTAEQGRQMGVYGPEVEVPETAPTLDRILGQVGRDPGWPR
ncbi:TIGR03086 family metal-binding protein [Micromonospora sp. WMMD1102]|uniref:TIGR03086 family metal-binding protein n=1 Tax=Micromonospora sp. WMMD1102 TaxID=3016105 RepID=UPI0024158F77|nr:TIGR03086 family metal-binding protein [Micromonospora sp. WMMD1102]MDG4785254.1 TIGR03086 family metal-binding protein [Micromonospora sp. WMMD1102]